jgi:hypothetical protein
MCARLFYLLLASLFAFVIISVAAFVYLEWWQAILASGFTFMLIVTGIKYLIKSMLGNLGQMAKGLFDAKSKVLRNASVDVHSVRSTSPPLALTEQLNDPNTDEFERAEAAADLQNLRWYEIEASIFPDANQAGPMQHWDYYDLRIVPEDAPPRGMWNAGDSDDSESELHHLRVVENGESREPLEDKPSGPRRLHFVAGLPAHVKAAKFQYYFEQFGHIALPTGPAISGRIIDR